MNEFASSPTLLLLVVLAGLVLAGGVLLVGLAAIASTIAELFSALFTGLRALAVVSLLIICIVAVLFASAAPAAPGVAVGALLFLPRP